MRVGIVGFGSVDRLYAGALARAADEYVRAVAEVNRDSLADARSRYGRDTYELLRQAPGGGIDLVIITLPDFLHRDPVVNAAERWIHILAEEPFANILAIADAMVTAVEKGKVKYVVEFFNRWSPPFTEAKRRVDARELVELTGFSAELNDCIFVPTWMLKWSAHSSPGWFLMSHSTDPAFWILSRKPSAVSAWGVKKLLVQQGIDTYESIDAILEYPYGMPIIYEPKIRLAGTKTAIDIYTPDHEIHVVTHERVNHPITDRGDFLGYHVGHPYTMLRSMINAVANDPESLVTHKDRFVQHQVSGAVHESVSTGRKIALNWYATERRREVV